MSQQFPPDDQVTRRRSETYPRRSGAERPDRDYYPPPTVQHKLTSDIEDAPTPESSSLYVPWWGFALVILAVAGLTCGLWGVVLLSRGNAADGPTPTPIFVVITSTATLGPSVESTIPSASDASPTPEISATPEVTPTAGLTTAIAVGNTITIVGTGGDGLAVRQGPGRDYQHIFVANDGDQFEVQDGPREADGYVWWYIVDPQNADRFGWAVADFMQVVQQ